MRRVAPNKEKKGFLGFFCREDGFKNSKSEDFLEKCFFGFGRANFYVRLTFLTGTVHLSHF